MRNETKNKTLSCEGVIFAQHHMKRNGIEPYTKKSLIRTITGVSLIALGVGTFIIPFTTLPLCVGGGVLLGCDVQALTKKYKYELNLLKMRLLK